MYQDNIYVLARSWPDFSLDVNSGNDISCSRYCSTQYLVLPSDSDGKESSYNAGFNSWVGKILWRRPPGKEYPLQYSSQENPKDRGAWWATVHGVAKSRIPLSNFRFISLHWKAYIQNIKFLSGTKDSACKTFRYTFSPGFGVLCLLGFRKDFKFL